ncbi:mfs general substrate transporter [Diplodia corticola]|uniref:Mfs general substrate transporter n=1 Tax=Diplodia corticola TaxID=236234 RepID=A0A1J9S752_9PEZI|nr:mfs general substrate transporter [Diplodia corticola]OJD35748.1 mfs general substrate transporter [Diplodia corticola]
MQSFIQYRKFRTHLKMQYERDREKTAALAQQQSQRRHDDHLRRVTSTPSSSDTFDSKPSSSADGRRDLERGEGGAPSLVQEEQPDAAPTADAEQLDHHAAATTEEPAERTPSPRPPSTTSRALQPVGTALGHALTGVSVRSRTSSQHPGGKIFIVGYEGAHDPLNPHNWAYGTRVFATFLVAGIGFVVGVASSIDAEALRPAAKEFGVSEVVESLATGLYLIGFGAGALFAGPFSETLGRNPVYIVTMTLYMVFIMASGLAPNIGAQLAFRFLAGLFGSTPLTCAGGSLSDLWNPMERVFAFPVFANAAFTGPVLGPVMGGFIAQSSAVSWRWVEWTTLIMSGLVLGAVVLFQPETYPPVLLRWKAQHLRRITGDERYVAEVELMGATFGERIKRALYRPFLLTLSEPIIILVALYLTVIYIVLFTFLDGYDFIFGEVYGVSQGITGLCFLGIAVGLFGASALVPIIYKWAKRDLKKIQEEGRGDRLPPEFRLWFSMLGGSFAIPISLFWLGWTSYPSISIWSPLAATVLFGYGILCVFISCYQYIIDSYEVYAASALASVTLIRYVAAGGMVVVGIPFYENVGVHWTCTILGCISLLLAPVPYMFYMYGSRIRSKSKFAGKVQQ